MTSAATTGAARPAADGAPEIYRRDLGLVYATLAPPAEAAAASALPATLLEPPARWSRGGA